MVPGPGSTTAATRGAAALCARRVSTARGQDVGISAIFDRTICPLLYLQSLAPVCALLPVLSSWRCPRRREQLTKAHGMHRQANRLGIARKDAHSMGVHLIDSALFGDQFSTAAMRRVFDDAAMVRSWM